jgi:hypothetical protein
LQRCLYITLLAKGRLQCGVKAITTRIGGDFRNINASDRFLWQVCPAYSITPQPG